MKSLHRLDDAINWFIPTNLLIERETRQRARMFILSHMFGPFLGNVIPLYLYVDDDERWPVLLPLTAAISAFWIFPFALKLSGAYRVLCFASIQNLMVAILWGCFFYGATSSPFLPWVITVPLLAYFYLGPSARNCLIVSGIIAANLATFIILHTFSGSSLDPNFLTSMHVIGTISIVSASLYVSMMALFYARILNSQTDLEEEARRQLQTAEELRRATREAQKAGLAKAEFLAKTSHELRTPLNAIIGYSELLVEEADPEADQDFLTDVNKIRTAGLSLLTLINNILDISKIEAGKMEVEIDTVDLAELIGEIVDRFSSTAFAKCADIVIHLERLAPVRTDRTKMAYVLGAILDNAIKYSSPGVISIELAARGSTAAITVTDSGPGVPAGNLPTLFEKFSSGSDISETKYQGPGLGLPLSAKLMGLIGGAVTVDTAAIKGASFCVSIPLSTCNEHPRLAA